MVLINLLSKPKRALTMQRRAQEQGRSRLLVQGQAEYLCTKCKELKPVEQFFISCGKVKWCKRCHGQAGINFKRENPEARKRYAWTTRVARLLRDFGITAADYERMLSEQHGLCKLCCQPEKSPGNALGRNKGPRLLAVDHDHVTGVVRGLLCSNCNRAIGLLRDDPQMLRRAVLYLETAGQGIYVPSVQPNTLGAPPDATSSSESSAWIASPLASDVE